MTVGGWAPATRAGVPFARFPPPLGAEQVGIALRGILPRDEIRVVADNFEPSAQGRVHPAWIHVFRRKILGDVLRNVGCNPILAFPVEEEDWFRTANDIDPIDAACLFLAASLQNPFI